MSPTPDNSPPRPAAWIREHLPALVLVLACATLATVAVSCSTTVNRGIVVPPAMPGAEYAGSDSCEQCHDTITKHFASSFHASLVAQGPNAMNVGCESCHGPASVHVESGGAARTIVNPDRNPEYCFHCHSNLRSQFAMADSHPVHQGRVPCSACHESHRGSAHSSGGTALLAANQQCLSCHPAQKGPHVFEHEAMREGCISCHHPHGSVNAKMLTERNAILCLKCHFQHQVAPGRVAIGAIDHTTFLARGTCWSAGCHEAVHGSQVTSSLRF